MSLSKVRKRKREGMTRRCGTGGETDDTTAGPGGEEKRTGKCVLDVYMPMLVAS